MPIGEPDYQPGNSQRLNVLISAYACEPEKGSEPQVGWQLALHLARFHEVTVVTRTNNREPIEKALASYTGPHPEFIYYDLPPWVLALKRHGRLISIYYIFWQLGVRIFVNDRLDSFDLIHHATFNSFRNPGFWWFCPAPVILGPLGGGQVCPWRFLPWFRRQILFEFLRSMSVINSYVFPHIFLSFATASKILIANNDTFNCVPWIFRHKVEKMLETGITPDQLVETRPKSSGEGVRFLWMSRLDKMKGCEILLRAFAQALHKCPDITLSIAGSGNEERPLKRLIRSLSIEKSINWRGPVPKAEVQDFMLQHDVFVFTSLRDTSGNVLLEAMATGMPTITFKHHGAAEITTNETSLRPEIARRKETVSDLASALVTLARSRELRERMGNAGRERIKSHFTWIKHAIRMSAIYQQTVKEVAFQSKLQQKTLRVLLSPRGIFYAVVVLALVGALEVSAVSFLKKNARQIIEDTVPGLAYAGQTSSTLSQSFNCTLMLILTTDQGKIKAYEKEIEVLSEQTGQNLKNYEKSIFDEEDAALFKKLVENRRLYLENRRHFIELIDQNRRQEAIQRYESSLLPAFMEYKKANDALLAYNFKQGQIRGERIIQLSYITQIAVAVIAIALFITGFALGFFR